MAETAPQQTQTGRSPVQKMNIKIEPTVLVFPKSLEETSKANIKIINNTTYYITYKIKTTTPKQYCVRPTAGILQPKTSVEINISLQLQSDSMNFMVKSKDKFLVVCRRLEDDVTPPPSEGPQVSEFVQNFWSSKGDEINNVSKNDPFFFEKRIRCEMAEPPTDKKTLRSDTECTNIASTVAIDSTTKKDSTVKGESNAELKEHESTKKSESSVKKPPVEPTTQSSSILHRRPKPQPSFNSTPVPPEAPTTNPLILLVRPPAIYFVAGLCFLFFIVGSLFSK